MSHDPTFPYFPAMPKALSQNLTVAEFIESVTAKAKGINNAMPLELVPHAVEYATKCFQPIREIWGNVPRSLSSGYRCRALNVAVGGSQSSQHMAVNAGDYGLRQGENIYSMFLRLLVSNLDYDQLLIEGTKANDPRSGWIHVSYNTLKSRGIPTSGFKADCVQRKEIKIVTFDQNGEGTTKTIGLEKAIEWADTRYRATRG